jgi:hypothetical protein
MLPYRIAAMACVSVLLSATATAQDVSPARALEKPAPNSAWNADSLGNHRVVVHAGAASTASGTKIDAMRATFQWRRRPDDPGKNDIIVIDATTGARVRNVAPVSISRDEGSVAFQPATLPGDYDVYFMPFRRTNKSANYPRIAYDTSEQTADPAWIAKHQLNGTSARSDAWRALPEASVVAYQAVDSLDAYTAMEVTATNDEVQALLARNGKSAYFVFPEDRANPIRMRSGLPLRWIEAGANTPFAGEAERGEFYVFQLGVFAARQNLSDVRLQFSSLTSSGGASIPSSRIESFNTGGVNWIGKPFTRTIAVTQGNVQPFWIGVDVPTSAKPGDYHGTVKVTPRNAPSTSVRVTLHVGTQTIAAHGDDEPMRLSRLRWLNSRLAEDNTVVPPFTPVTRHGDTVSLLGRSIVVASTGLPRRILSRFTDGNTRVGTTARDIITSPISIVVDTGSGSLVWRNGKPRFTPQLPGAMEWSATTTGGAVTMRTHARLEFDGDIEYQVSLTTSRSLNVRDIRIEVPYAREASRYMMGLGQKGGVRPADFHWKWDVQKNQDAIWIGDVTAGLQVSLKDEHYSRPLNTNFYHLKPLVMPASWSNDGRGGCDVVDQNEETTMLRCYSGPRTIRPGETLRYDFRLLVTPFKTLDTQEHFANRYFHAFAPLDSVAKTGANVINVHHNTEINPYLNYPFLRPDAMKSYIDSAHARGMKVKIYYTVRELTNHTPELFALQSLGDEIFSAGNGGGPSWLQEHFGANYTAGWFVPERNDAAIITNGQSRWHNSYIEGLDWLARNIGIDGLYLDDVAFDRTTMQRVRKVLDRHRPGALIDLHSATQYDPADGFASSANLYMEYFPYINRLWFGEGFDYDTTPPDYWLVEMSGIPFGLMGEMLQGGGNPWRGMVYGMTNRVYVGDPTYHGDPIALWKAWDQFGIKNSRMIGYWDPHAPVVTGRPDILATSYVGSGKVMVALGSWASEKTSFRLTIDWKSLGIDPATAVVTQPAIAGFQDAATFAVDDPIPLSPGKGALLIIRRP